MGGRVEWSRLEGDDVEAVVAMMLNREHPNSMRVTPSRGDGGVDILDRGAGPGGRDVVYQVKRHATPLNAGQKTKTKKSLTRLLDPVKRDKRWGSLDVCEWRLVMPWDPSPEADKWLQELGSSLDVKVHWDGLTVVDQLAAKYPDVIDYYLHGGRSAVEDAYRQAMTLMSLPSAAAAGISAAELSANVKDALGLLSGIDPHYVYEFRFGHGEAPEPPARPWLVLSRIVGDREGWCAVDVIARCAASVHERPITVDGVFTAEKGSQFAADLEEFFAFGTPFSSPAGAYTGTLDAPGGLGGDVTGAAVTLQPVMGAELGENSELRVEMLDPDGRVIAEVNVDRTDVSSGELGHRGVLSDVNGFFDLTFRTLFADNSTTWRIDVGFPPGSPVRTAEPSVNFVEAFHAPNGFRVSPRHAPAHMGSQVALMRPRDPDTTQHLARVANVIRALNGLQEHSREVIRVPVLSQVTEADYAAWVSYALVLSGETLEVDSSEMAYLEIELPAGTSFPQETFQTLSPMTTSVGDQELDFGHLLVEVVDPHVIDELTQDGQTRFRYRCRLTRYTLYTGSGAEAEGAGQ